MESSEKIQFEQQSERLIEEISKRKKIEKQLDLLTNELCELKQIEHQLQQLAYYDDITSLPNRMSFIEKLHSLLMHDEAQASVMFIDIDRFKQLNDSVGHENGNAVLRMIGKRFSSTLPKTALLARYGGDEFSLMFEGANENISIGIAQDLLDSLREPITVLGDKFTITASVGLSYFPSVSKNIPELLRHADTAMYQAKKQGGNKYVVYGGHK